MGGVDQKDLLIGHLTDLHLNGRWDRRERFECALARAREFGVDHLVLTGDLTKNGSPSQFRELASCLASWASERVTIIPGNHDEGDAFDRSMASGELSRFQRTSQGPFQLGGALKILPLDTRFAKRSLAFKAIGKIGQEQVRKIASAVADLSVPLLIAQHHGPHVTPWSVFHGLTDRQAVLSLIGRREDVVVLAGHDHVVQDLFGGKVRIAGSVAHHPDPLRVYRLETGSRTFSNVLATPGGSFMSFGRRWVGVKNG